MAISKNKIKYVHSLKDKKFRNQYGTFVAEGNKMVSELLEILECQLLVGTKGFLQATDLTKPEEVVEADEADLARISFVKTPQQALAVFYQPKHDIDVKEIGKKLTLALDGVQDPGNLGTIVRLADWYGIENIFCSKDSADIYNPKTVQATMGAIARVKVHYVDLSALLSAFDDTPIYGTFLDGENMYEKELSTYGILVMGNEGNGIRPETEKLIAQKLYIPNFPQDRQTSESLNVAIATAITCAEFRRRCL